MKQYAAYFALSTTLLKLCTWYIL